MNGLLPIIGGCVLVGCTVAVIAVVIAVFCVASGIEVKPDGPVLADVCQVGGWFANPACRHRESGGLLCERIDPHSGWHEIGEHTIQHARAGSGYTCTAIDEGRK